jgi:hypothetical protein
MEIEKFKRAKQLLESIDDYKSKKFRLEKMKTRENDDEFQYARETGYNAICHFIETLENKFKEL